MFFYTFFVLICLSKKKVHSKSIRNNKTRLEHHHNILKKNKHNVCLDVVGVKLKLSEDSRRTPIVYSHKKKSNLIKYETWVLGSAIVNFGQPWNLRRHSGDLDSSKILNFYWLVMTYGTQEVWTPVFSGTIPWNKNSIVRIQTREFLMTMEWRIQ